MDEIKPSKPRTIVTVLRSGGDFQLSDVTLIANRIISLWQSEEKPKIICLTDIVKNPVDFGNFELIPLMNDFPGTWSRIDLYGPGMKMYRPFLYMDLDTAVIKTVEHLFDLVKGRENDFIPLEDFWQPSEFATGLVWFPDDDVRMDKVFRIFMENQNSLHMGGRMDPFLRRVIKANTYWQRLTKTIYDFKPKSRLYLKELPEKADLVFFHGKPRIPQAAEMIEWVRKYVDGDEKEVIFKPNVTVIIPYNKDRGFLQSAIDSVDTSFAQLLVSKGDGNWPQNFNKVLDKAEGAYIKYLHEDDMLTKNGLADSYYGMVKTGADFMHANAYELNESTGEKKLWIPEVYKPTVKDMLRKNYLHSVTLMYKREIFEKIGSFNETLHVVSEEYEFNLRCLKNSFKIEHINSVVGIYRRHPGQKIRYELNADKIREREMVKSWYNEK